MFLIVIFFIESFNTATVPKSNSLSLTTTSGPVEVAYILIVWGLLFWLPTILIERGNVISPNFLVIRVTLMIDYPCYSIYPDS